MARDLAGARSLVTGGTHGIGRALVGLLRTQGAEVLTCGRDEAALAELEGQGVATVRADLGDEAGRAAVAAAVAARWPGLDLLVNNAGVQVNMDLAHPPPDLAEQAEREMRVNFLAPLLLSQALLPWLRQGHRPAIVNVTSPLAWQPRATAPVYSASKAALANLTISQRLAFAPLGVRVAEAAPPLVATGMTEGRGGRGKISAEAAARQLLAGLKAETETILIGKARAGRLLARLAPGLLRRMVNPAAP